MARTEDWDRRISDPSQQQRKSATRCHDSGRAAVLSDGSAVQLRQAMDNLVDVWHAVRTLRRHAGFTASMILLFAVGIGASSAIVAVVYALLWRPLPLESPEHLLAVFQTVEWSQQSREPISGVRLDAYGARTDLFDGVVGAASGQFNVVAGGFAHRVTAELVSDDFFETVGARPLIGRTFDAFGLQRDDIVPCVIGERLWRGRFGSDPGVIGTILVADGLPMTIVGVLSDEFTRWRAPAEIWVPYRFTPTLLSPEVIARDGYLLFRAFARLRGDVSLDQARSELEALDARLDVELQGAADDSTAVHVVPARDAFADDALYRSVQLLVAVAVVVLAGLAVSIGSLIVARNVARHRELYIRIAVGASRGRILRQMGIEVGAPAIAGGLLGGLAAGWILPVISALAPAEARAAATITLDYRIAVFGLSALGLVIGAGALMPAWFLTRPGGAAHVRRVAGHSASATATRIRSMLIAGQMALTAPLVVAAILATTNFARLQSIDPGFDVRMLLTARLALPASGYDTVSDASRLHRRIIDFLGNLPDVSSVALASSFVDYLTADGGPAGVSITVEGSGRYLNGSPEHASFVPGRRVVSPEYFDIVGLRLLRGRLLAHSDTTATQPVAVINETMARRHWSGINAVGKRINFESVRPGRPLRAPWVTVVGVVSDARHHDLDAPPRPEIYVALDQSGHVIGDLVLLVRTSVDPQRVAVTLQDTMRRVDPLVPVVNTRTMADLIRETTAASSYASQLLTLFAVLGIALSGTGIYGLARHAATQRTAELGIRLAMGAPKRHVFYLVARKGLAPALYGIVVGAGLVAVQGRVLATLVPGLEPVGAGTLAAAFVLLISMAGLVSALPARAASRLDISRALRVD